MRFPVTFERDPTFVMNAHIMTGWLLVMLAMCSFWIPEEAGSMDRSGLNITTILASAVLQTEAKLLIPTIRQHVIMAMKWLK